MISVNQAEHIVLKHVKLLPCEAVPLAQVYSRILRENVYSDRLQPPFDKALMDGVAIKLGTSPFFLEGLVAAGEPQRHRKKPYGCFQIMTGAVVPKGCDTIIPVEQIMINEGKVYVKENVQIIKGQFIRPKGSDAHKGELLLTKNILLNTPSMGVLAGVGKSKVKVSVKPKIAIISTGDELVAINRVPKLYQTRLSNSYTLQSLLEESGLAKATLFHYPDNKKILLKGLRHHLRTFDILILSGGVSMGEFDYIPQVLKELGVRVLFHKVAQKPGKPLWFGKSRDGKVVFALPGNPASTQICAYRYVIPFLQKAAGLEVKKKSVILSEVPMLRRDKMKDNMIYFLPVRIKEENGTCLAEVVPTGGSGDFAALARADGFIEYDQRRKTLRPYFSWRL